MKNRSLLSVLLLFLPLWLSAGIRSSHIELPEKAVQGDTLEVRYVMEISGSWRTPGIENGADGLRLLRIRYKRERLSPYVMRVTAVCRFKCVAAGTVAFPPLPVRTDKGDASVAGDTLQVAPHPGYGEAWLAARDFLLQQGEECRNLEWQHSDRDVHAFYDYRRDAFAWARKSEVVAYGTGNFAWGRQCDQTIVHLFSAYQAGQFVEIPEGSVGPLLGEIAYGQNGTYCEGFPKASFRGQDSTCLVGCGPVALAQVLQYYAPSVRPAGKGRLTVAGADPVPVDIQGHDWSALKPNEQLYLAAASAQAQLSLTNSSSYLADFPHALTANWGFSPTFRYRRDFPMFKLAEWLRTELDAGRPVFLATEDHVFVCDGYKDGFLHFNLGWGGLCNGWYRLPENAYLPECLTGVTPMGAEKDYALAVTLKKSGTLAAAIPADRVLEVTRLKITGKIRGEDIALLRRMATDGMLTELDLSEAKIVGNGYLYTQELLYAELDASDMTFTSEYKNVLFGAVPGTKREWNMTEVTDAQWKEMTRQGLTRGWDFTLVRDADGVRIRYYSRDNVIGTRMFFGCDRLRTLRLPKTAVSIQEQAFANCFCLERLYVPDAVHITKQALEGTRPFLERHKE